MTVAPLHEPAQVYLDGGANLPKGAGTGKWLQCKDGTGAMQWVSTPPSGISSAEAEVIANARITAQGFGTAAHSAASSFDAAGSAAAAQANAETAIANKAPLVSAALAGTPTAPTAPAGTVTTQIATTAFVASAVTGTGVAPTITNPGAQVGQVGVPVELHPVATNATAFAATGLPAGTTLNSATGRISGTPTAAAVYTVIYTASNANGSVFVEITWTISAASAPTVTKPAAQTGNVGTPITPLQIEATNTVKYTAASLPAGLSINEANGRISGTPTTAEAPVVTITVENAEKATKTTTFTWTISAAVVLPAIRVGEPKSEAVTGTTAAAPSPTQAVVGDLLLMLVQLETNTATLTIPAGWTQVGTLGNISARNFYILWRIYDGSAMPTLTASTSTTWDIRILAVQGAESVDLTSGWNNQATTTKPKIASVTTTAANDLDLAILCKVAGAGYNVIPSGYTAFNSKNQFKVFYKNQAVAGASGATEAELSATEVTTAITIALKREATPEGISARLVESNKAVEPFGLPSGTASITVALCTAESGQDENTETEHVPTSTTRITGTPSHPWISIQAVNASGVPLGGFTTPRLKVTVTPSVPTVTKPSAQVGHVSQGVSLALAATESPTSWTITGLPTGLTASGSTGVISGTPTTIGSFTVKATATNATGTSVAVEWSWTIEAAVTATVIHGLALNSDDESTQTLAAIALNTGTRIPVRRDFSGTPAEAGTKAAFFHGKNAIWQPIFSINSALTSAQAKSLKAIAEAMKAADALTEYIEFGNETNYPGKAYENTQAGGEAYGARAKEGAEALVGTGIKILVQGSDAGKGGEQVWLKGVLKAWPKCWEHSNFGGWTIHAYPGNHEYSTTAKTSDTFGIPMMERMTKALKEAGDLVSKFFVSEWGAPSTNAGTTMTSGQSLNWSEAKQLLEWQGGELERVSEKRVGQFLLYQAHDQAAEGGTEREWYFGLLTSSGGEKGTFTAFGRAWL